MKNAFSLCKEKRATKDPWFSVPITILIFLLLFLFICFFIVLVSDINEQPIKPSLAFVKALFDLESKKELLTFLGLSMGGIILALQAMIANRRAKAMEKGNDNIEQGQRQERLKNAIEHLGETSASVRLGGIYELFHLANDSDYLQETVLDILCAHIRRTTSECEYKKKYPSKPSEEIQSLLTLLFVQKKETFKNHQANLQGCWLIGANLNYAWLERANLSTGQLQGVHLKEAWLQEARLTGAQLQDANLSRAQLQRARLEGAQLQRAHLEKARLQDAHLEKAQLQRASLEGAQLQRAHLDEAQLQGAKLKNAQLQEACLANARLQKAYLFGARLQGAWLSGAKLQEANLDKAQLHELHLENAQLQGATLTRAQLQLASLIMAGLQGANLFEVKLQGANLDKAQLQGAILNLAQLQGAVLHQTSLQGVTSQSIPDYSFKERMKDRAGEESELSGVTFANGLTENNLSLLVEDMTADATSRLRRLLRPHIKERPSNALPEDSDVITDPPYTHADAEQWIADYEAAMSEVPEENDS